MSWFTDSERTVVDLTTVLLQGVAQQDIYRYAYGAGEALLCTRWARAGNVVPQAAVRIAMEQAEPGPVPADRVPPSTLGPGGAAVVRTTGWRDVRATLVADGTAPAGGGNKVQMMREGNRVFVNWVACNGDPDGVADPVEDNFYLPLPLGFRPPEGHIYRQQLSYVYAWSMPQGALVVGRDSRDKLRAYVNGGYGDKGADISWPTSEPFPDEVNWPGTAVPGA